MRVKPLKKVLSRTDTGESRTHQSGVLIPVNDGERLFPAPMGRGGGSAFKCQDQAGRLWTFRFYHKAKKSESRITYITPYFRQYLLRSGDTMILWPPCDKGDPYRIDFHASSLAPVDGEEVFDVHTEGAVRTIKVNQYERDPHNRKSAIKQHGVRCFGCRVEMAETYGEIARGYIHIRHTKPFACLQSAKKPNINDLVPLCPNCHAVVHLADPPLTINALKDIIRGQHEEADA